MAVREIRTVSPNICRIDYWKSLVIGNCRYGHVMQFEFFCPCPLRIPFYRDDLVDYRSYIPRGDHIDYRSDTRLVCLYDNFLWCRICCHFYSRFYCHYAGFLL